MLPKFAWILAPLALYGLLIAGMAWRGRAPSRQALNVHVSLLLLAYLLATAGLGIFWVANQQLPVFDWHYLFGYTTLLLVGLHLFFNFPVVLRWLSRSSAKQSAAPGGRLALGKTAALVLALAAAFYVGSRQGGGGEVRLDIAEGPVQSVIRYHEFSSESRSRVFKRAPGVEWGGAPAAFKAYPSAPKVVLGKGDAAGLTLAQALHGAPATRRGNFDLSDLGRVLHLSAGITLRRGGNALRAAPSSGALFPSELYVIARRVQGLEPGRYHYDPEHHRLALLGPLPESGAMPQADDADLVVVLTALFRRTGYKYHNRAYRYALADAGHLLENTRLAARAAGMHASFLTLFDDARIAQALGVDGVEEGVLSVMPLHRSLPPSLSPGPALLPAVPGAPARIGVTGLVHQLTSLQSASSRRGGAGIALPPPEPAARELYATIVQRRSQRRFSGGALPLAALSSILADMRQRPELSAAVEASVVVNRVDGLAPGVYRYGPGHALRLVRAGQLADQAQSAALSQDVIGDAAAVLILSAERDSMLAQGARGYRHGLLEAGLMGERWLLSAVARGLGACPVGAFYDDEAAALVGADPRRHWVLHFAALGVPAGD